MSELRTNRIVPRDGLTSGTSILVVVLFKLEWVFKDVFSNSLVIWYVDVIWIKCNNYTNSRPSR